MTAVRSISLWQWVVLRETAGLVCGGALGAPTKLSVFFLSLVTWLSSPSRALSITVLSLLCGAVWIWGLDLQDVKTLPDSPKGHNTSELAYIKKIIYGGGIYWQANPFLTATVIFLLRPWRELEVKALVAVKQQHVKRHSSGINRSEPFSLLLPPMGWPLQQQDLKQVIDTPWLY